MFNKFKNFISIAILTAFLSNNILTVPLTSAQILVTSSAVAANSFTPLLLKGLILDPKNPLNTDFIVDTGSVVYQSQEVEAQAQVLMKYFLTSLTFSSKDLWVNLSPEEPDRIIPEALAKTQMGQDMLAQDYLLKKLVSGMLDPSNEAGERFWDEIYRKIYAVGLGAVADNERPQHAVALQNMDIPVDILSKVWIVPGETEIVEQGDRVFVTKAHLKVLTDKDYLVSGKESSGKVVENNLGNSESALAPEELSNTLALIRTIIIPTLEQEINTSADFAKVRQIYYSFILAHWYKSILKNSILGREYFDQSKVSGIDKAIDEKQKIYQNYLDLFRKSSDSIKEEYDPNTQQIIARKYSTGGVIFDSAMATTAVDPAKFKEGIVGQIVMVKGGLKNADLSADISSDSALLSQEQKDFVSTNLPWIRDTVFKEYEKYKILTAEGTRLLGLGSVEDLTEEQILELHQVITYFKNIGTMSKDDILTQFPQKYFKKLDKSFSQFKDMEFMLVDGCPNFCLFCPIHKNSKIIASMPYPLIVMAVLQNPDIYIPSYSFEPLYYRDASGALFADVIKIFKRRLNDAVVTHGYVLGYEVVAQENIRHLKEVLPETHHEILISVHPVDQMWFRFKKNKASDDEIVDYYVKKYVDLIKEFNDSNIKVYLRQTTPKDKGPSTSEWEKIAKMIWDKLNKLPQNRRLQIITWDEAKTAVLSPRYFRFMGGMNIKMDKRLQNEHVGFFGYDSVMYIFSPQGDLVGLTAPAMLFIEEIEKYGPLTKDDKLQIILNIKNGYNYAKFYERLGKSVPDEIPNGDFFSFLDKYFDWGREVLIGDPREIFELLKAKQWPVPISSQLSMFKDNPELGIFPQIRTVKIASMLVEDENKATDKTQVGGIHFDENLLQIKSSGNEIEFNGAWQEQFRNKPITGFSPIIYSIQNIADVNSLLK